MIDKSKQLKFPEGAKVAVEIQNMGMEENDFGSEYIVRIVETIDGFDHFKPSDGLRRKTDELNIGKGDRIIIEKVAPSEKYKYGYFNVEMMNNEPQKIHEAVKDHPLGAGFAQKDDKMDFHEMGLRLKAVEEELTSVHKIVNAYGETIALLMKEQNAENRKRFQQKEGANDLPF